MSNLTLKQLRYFEALAHHGHFGQAAQACNISQPALSMQIRELEATLGNILFERNVRQEGLTPFGKEFALRAREILRSVDELGDLGRSMQDKLTGRMRIGIIPTIAPYLLPSIISTLKERYPDLDLHVRETLTQKLIHELIDGKLDAAIVALPVSEPSLMEVDLFSEEFVLVRPTADRHKPVPDGESLRRMRLLLLEEGHCFRDQALSFCNIRSSTKNTEGSKEPAIKEMLDGSSLSTLVQMVGAGMGVTLIPEMAVTVETRSANVSVTRFNKPEPTRTIGMIWRKTNPLGPQLINISDCVRQSASPN